MQIWGPQALLKAIRRTQRFVVEAACFRRPMRAYSPLVWLLLFIAAFALANSLLALNVRTFSFSLVLLALLLALSAIDARYGVIPDAYNLAIAGFGIARVLATPGAVLFNELVAAGLIGVAFAIIRELYRGLRGHDAMSWGEVKLLAAATLWTGAAGIPTVIAAAALSALASLAVMRREGHAVGRDAAFPLGPHLALGIWLVWVFGPFQLEA